MFGATWMMAKADVLGFPPNRKELIPPAPAWMGCASRKPGRGLLAVRGISRRSHANRASWWPWWDIIIGNFG